MSKEWATTVFGLAANLLKKFSRRAGGIGTIRTKTEDARHAAHKSGARLSIRIYLESGVRIGPGKIALLEAIEESGSISGGGRLLKMSYKRAWDLVEDLNTKFSEPVVATMQGGSHGGGAQLTQRGKMLVEHYRQLEQAAYDAGKLDLRALGRMTPDEN